MNGTPFRENTDNLVNSANSIITNASNAAISQATGGAVTNPKAIDYHLLNNIGIPTELPGANSSLLANFGALAQSGDFGAIIGAVQALFDPQQMLHLVEGVMAKNPVTSAGSGVVPEFSALAGLTGQPAGQMQDPIQMFVDPKVYKDPFNSNAWRQTTAQARTVVNNLIGDQSNKDLATALQVLSLPLYIPGFGQEYKVIFTPVSSALNLVTSVEGILKNLFKVQAFQNPYSSNPDEPTKELFDKPQVEILRLRSSSAWFPWNTPMALV